MEVSDSLHHGCYGSVHFKFGGKASESGFGMSNICYAPEGCHEEIDRAAFQVFTQRYWKKRARGIIKELTGKTARCVLVDRMVLPVSFEV
jgi:hypothetical protein